MLQKHLMHQYNITSIVGRVTSLCLKPYASLVKSFISLDVLMDGIALKNTQYKMSELNALVALVLNFSLYAGIVVLCIANDVSMKMPCHVSVESLYATLPLFKPSMLAMSD